MIKLRDVQNKVQCMYRYDFSGYKIYRSVEFSNEIFREKWNYHGTPTKSLRLPRSTSNGNYSLVGAMWIVFWINKFDRFWKKKKKNNLISDYGTVNNTVRLKYFQRTVFNLLSIFTGVKPDLNYRPEVFIEAIITFYRIHVIEYI